MTLSRLHLRRTLSGPLMVATALALALALALPLALGMPHPARAQAQLSHGAAQIPVPLIDLTESGSIEDATERLLDRLLHGAQRGQRTGRMAAPDTRIARLSTLRPVSAHGLPPGSRLRASGERSVLEFEIHLSDPDQMRALRLSTQSSINVLPERSYFRVHLNEMLMGTGRLHHFTEIGFEDIPVARDAARSGVNRVRLELVHFHRIFCGPEASFSLWSDIDLARSGAVLDAPMPTPTAATFVMGLAASAATGAGVEIRGADQLGAERNRWVSILTQRITQTLGGDPVPFHLTDPWTVDEQAAAGARVTFLPASEPGIRFVHGGDGAQVMLVGVPPGGAAGVLPLLDDALAPRDRRSTVALLDTQRHVTLAELGFPGQELQDRHARRDLRFRLPDDYVVMTNLKAFLRLTYIYAENLPENAMLQIHVNDTNIRLLPLRGQGGRLIEDFPIRFEARHLRAGENTLAFEMFIPGDPPELPCPQRNGPVVAISQFSTIIVPYSPSMYLADMHHAFAALTPAGVRAGDTAAQAFSDHDVMTLRTALAQDLRPGNVAGSARLHLIPPDELSSMPAGNYRISRRTLEAALGPPARSGRDQTAPSGTLDLDFPVRQRREPQPAVLTAGWDWLTRSFTETLQWMHPRAGTTLEDWLSRQSGQAILLQLDPVHPAHLWLLRSPDAEIGIIAAAMARARSTGQGPRGQISVLDHDGNWQNWYAPDRQPMLLEPLSLTNIRHVMGNFVSATPMRFVSLLFLLALISAVFALRLVIATREHKP